VITQFGFKLFDFEFMFYFPLDTNESFRSQFSQPISSPVGPVLKDVKLRLKPNLKPNFGCKLGLEPKLIGPYQRWFKPDFGI